MSSFPKKDWFLYDSKWNETLDTYLIRHLMEREKECNPTPPVDSPHALICAMEALNKELSADLRYVDILERVNFLRKRYTCFKKLASRVETDWDALNNRVSMDDAVRKVIFRDDPLAEAYYTKGDPQWFKLCRLFGWTSITNEASPTVIVISKSPHALYYQTYNTCASGSDDEVIYPVMKAPTARKLLFEDNAQSIIGPSQHKGAHLYHVWPPIQGRIGYPLPNIFSKKPLDFGGNGRDIEHSSCASSSPHK